MYFKIYKCFCRASHKGSLDYLVDLYPQINNNLDYQCNEQLFYLELISFGKQIAIEILVYVFQMVFIAPIVFDLALFFLLNY